MAEARRETTTSDEIWLNEAVALLATALGGSEKFAQQLLFNGLKAGDVPWSGVRNDGIRFTGDATFWQDHSASRLDVDWSDNSARHRLLLLIVPSNTDLDLPDAVHAIKVLRKAVLALLPSTATTAPAPAELEASDEASDGPQVARATASLIKAFPPNGQIPKRMSVKAAQAKSRRYVDGDPDKGLPSWDSYARAIKKLGRAP
jgi:hypothetical protein